MTARLPSYWRTLSITVISALFWSLSIAANAQTNGLTSGFTLDFKKSQDIASVDEVVSNVVKAVNRTSRPIRFTIDLASPAGWKVVNRTDRLFTVAPRDSMFIPVRMIPSKDTQGDVNYFINATAYSEFGNALASSPWTLEIKKISLWKMFVDNRQVFFGNDADSAGVSVRLQNLGNSIEKIKVTMTPDVKLKVVDGEWNTIRDNTILTTLAAGSDTTFVVNVKVINDRQKGYFFSDTPDANNLNQNKKHYRLQIQAKATGNKNDVKGRRVDFLKLTENVKFEDDRGSSKIPLTVELNSYNVLSNFTNFTLDLRGQTDLGRLKYLRYNFQAIITNSAVTGVNVLPSNQFVQYASPKFTVSAGNIGENMGILVNGQGAKAAARIGKFEVGGIYVNNANRPGRLAANDLSFYGARVGFKFSRYSNLQLQFINRTDNFNVKEGQLFRLRMDHRFSVKHRVSLTAGYSQEQDSYDPDSTFQQTGYGAELSYGGRVGKVIMSVVGAYNSENFMTLVGGVRNANANIRYSLGGRSFLGVRASHNYSRPITNVRGFEFRGEPRKRDLYELQYQWRAESGNFTLFPRYTNEQILGLKIENTGGGIIYSSNRGRNIRLYSRFFTGFSKLPDFEDIEPFLVARWENRLRYKNLNVIARYNYGPASITENFRIVNDRINPQSVFISAFATMYFRKARVQFKPRLNTRYESVLARWRMTASQDFSYYSKDGYVFTVGTELLSIKQGESPLTAVSERQGIEGVLNTFQQSNFFLRIGVKKEFGFKRPGSKSYDMKVAVFKDSDGNGIRDKGEEFVESVILTVKGKSAMTGKSGVATFKNLSLGNYLIESDVMGDRDGWFDADDTPIVLDKDQTVYIPLTRGVQITGKIIAQKASYSAFTDDVKVEGIRVSAVDEEGRVFSALTEKSGAFSLFVPLGKYEIKASGAGVDSRLQFAQDVYPLEINNADAGYQLSFYLIEKNRRLNIKRFNNN